MTGKPLTAHDLAEALGCFSNAAIGAVHNGTHAVACVAQGIDSVVWRLQEISEASADQKAATPSEPALEFTWSAWESAFTRPDGEPDGLPTSISECTLDGKRVGSVMRFGTGRYTAFFPDQPHCSHIETEARAKGLVEHAAGGGPAPLDPRQIVRALCDSPRAATEEEVRHLVKALVDERDRMGVLYQMRQRSPAADWIWIDLCPPPKDTPVLIGRAGFKPQMVSLPSNISNARWPTLESIDEPRRFEPPTHYAYVKGPEENKP